MRIGFFDSGVGGISVLKKVQQHFPNHEYVYYADSGRAPYGKKTNEEIMRYSFEAIEFLINQGVEIVVIACNTATKIALKQLRETFNGIVIIGIEPPILQTLKEVGEHQKIIVFATPVTTTCVSNDTKYEAVLNRITLCPVTKLVSLAEQGKIKENISDYLLEKLKQANLDKEDLTDYSHVLLGCTHFPFFEKEFKNVFKHQNIIDGTELIIDQLKTLITKECEPKSEQKTTYFKDRIQVKPHLFANWLNN